MQLQFLLSFCSCCLLSFHYAPLREACSCLLCNNPLDSEGQCLDPLSLTLPHLVPLPHSPWSYQTQLLQLLMHDMLQPSGMVVCLGLYPFSVHLSLTGVSTTGLITSDVASWSQNGGDLLRQLAMLITVTVCCWASHMPTYFRSVPWVR